MTLPAKLVLPDGTQYLKDASASDPVIHETLGFFDPPMVEYFDLDIGPDWGGDFDHVNLMLRFPDSNQTQANAIAQWWVLTESDLEWLWHIQPYDEDLYVNAKLQNKKNWHLNTNESIAPTRPIWIKNGEVRYGLMVYGHSKVRVKGSYTFRANFPANQVETAEFVKVQGITRAMMEPMGEYVDYVVEFRGGHYSTRVRSGVIPLIEQGYVQVCTEPNKARKISITNKGIKLMFVPGTEWVNKPAGEFYLWKGALA